MRGARGAVAEPNPDRQVADALARYAGVSEVWMIPWDGRTADLAALRGSTWGEAAPRGGATVAVGQLAQAVTARLALTELADTPEPSSEAAPALTD